MELLDNPQFVVSAVVAGFVIGLARAGFGGAIAFVGVLILAQTVPPTVAAAILLPMLCFADPFAVWLYRHKVHWPSIRILLPGALVGIVIGALIIGSINDDVVRIIVAILALVLVGYAFLFRHASAKAYKPATGSVLGMLAGISSFIIHAGHPPVAGYLLPLKLPRLEFIGTFSVLFITVNYIKLVPYAMLGLLDLSRLAVAAAFFPIVMLGLAAGKYLATRMSDRIFYNIIYVSTLVLGTKMMYEGVTGLMAS